MKLYDNTLYTAIPEIGVLVTKLVEGTLGLDYKFVTWKATNVLLCNLIEYRSIQKYEKANSNLSKIIRCLHHHEYVRLQVKHGQYIRCDISSTPKFTDLFLNAIFNSR